MQTYVYEQEAYIYNILQCQSCVSHKNADTHTHTHFFCEVCGQRSSRSDEVYGKKLQKWAGIPSEDAEKRERGEEGEGTECTHTRTHKQQNIW